MRRTSIPSTAASRSSVLLDEVAERKRLETAENNPRRRHPAALETGVQPTVRKEA